MSGDPPGRASVRSPSGAASSPARGRRTNGGVHRHEEALLPEGDGGHAAEGHHPLGDVFVLAPRLRRPSLSGVSRRPLPWRQSVPVTEAALPYFVDFGIENVHLVEITAYSDEDAYTIEARPAGDLGAEGRRLLRANSDSGPSIRKVPRVPGGPPWRDPERGRPREVSPSLRRAGSREWAEASADALEHIRRVAVRGKGE
jgi:hypothetical protein